MECKFSSAAGGTAWGREVSIEKRSGRATVWRGINFWLFLSIFRSSSDPKGFRGKRGEKLSFDKKGRGNVQSLKSYSGASLTCCLIHSLTAFDGD